MKKAGCWSTFWEAKKRKKRKLTKFIFLIIQIEMVKDCNSNVN